MTVEKWLIHLIGVGAIMEKALKYVGEKEYPGEVIQVGLKDVIDGIRLNVFGCAMEHSIQNVFFLDRPLSRHYTVKTRT